MVDDATKSSPGLPCAQVHWSEPYMPFDFPSLNYQVSAALFNCECSGPVEGSPQKSFHTCKVLLWPQLPHISWPSSLSKSQHYLPLPEQAPALSSCQTSSFKYVMRSISYCFTTWHQVTKNKTKTHQLLVLPVIFFLTWINSRPMVS